jgi:hypothetical protein
MSSRGRFTTRADFPRHDCSPYRGLHVRRDFGGFVHRSRAIFCRPVPNPNRPNSQLDNRWMPPWTPGWCSLFFTHLRYSNNYAQRARGLGCGCGRLTWRPTNGVSWSGPTPFQFQKRACRTLGSWYNTWNSNVSWPHNTSQLLGLRHRRYTAPSAWHKQREGDESTSRCWPLSPQATETKVHRGTRRCTART